MTKIKTKLSTVMEEFRELDMIFKSGSDLDVVERGYGRKLVHAISIQNEVLECESLKSLGDLYLHKAKINDNKVKNFNKACLLYKELFRYYKSIGEKQTVQHRIKYAEKCMKLVHDQENTQSLATNSGNTILSVSMALNDMKREIKMKGYGMITMMSLIGGYTNSLVKAIVQRNGRLEIESLKSLGDLYLEEGTIGKDEAAFEKSAGLYRAALDRCEDSDGRETLEHRIKYVANKQEKERKKSRKGLQTGRLGNKKGGNDNRLTSPPSPILTHGFHDLIGRKNYRRMNVGEGDTPSFNSRERTEEDTDSTYQKHLKEGCRALQTGDLDTTELNFSAALKIVHVTGLRWKEAETLCKLSDVYLKRGMTTKDGGNFTKAAALCNAALERSSKKDKKDITQTIKKITPLFVKHVLTIEQPVYDNIEKHKSMLRECRAYVEDEIKRIEQQIDPYILDDDDPSIRNVEKMRAEAIKALFDTIVHQRRTFIASLVDECIEVMGPPPCKYAMIGLGSQATGLATPYSDLEFAILIEKETEGSVSYFHNLTYYLHLKVINLGETILPAMAIKSLNDFESENKQDNWFYDSVTTRGFSFDGAMPEACKTPLGRGKTCHLIRTPRDMTMILEHDVTLHLKKGYHLASILGNVSLITGDYGLVCEYKTAWDQKLKKKGRKLARLVAGAMLKENSKIFERQDEELKPSILDVKKEIYRFSSLAVSFWALLYNIQSTTIWETIQKMQEKGAINDENKHHLMVMVSISAELRLRTYMNNRGQVEHITALSSTLANSDISEISKKVFYISNTKQLMRYYFTATPLKWFFSQFDNREVSVIKEPPILFDNSSKLQGVAYLSLCDYKSSKTYTEQALQDELSRYGKSAIHPSIVNSLFILGYVCTHLGNYQEAVSYFEKSLQMKQSIYAEFAACFHITKSMSNLSFACVQLQYGDYRKAVGYHDMAKRMKRSIVLSFVCLGAAWGHVGDHRKAITNYEQSLKMMRSIYGESTEHPDIVKSLNNLGNSWVQDGDFRKAVGFYNQALRMERSIYGKKTAHPDIATTLNNLGNVWREVGDHRKAVSYHEQSLQIMQSAYGERTAHPDVARSLTNLGITWSKLGDHRKAINYHQQSLQMMRSAYGEDTAHPDIVSALTNLGTTWSELGDHRKAISYLNQVQHMYEIICGESTVHADIAKSLHNLGTVWSSLGDYRMAISYHDQSLKMRRCIYGESNAHPDIAGSLNDLGVAWVHLGDFRKAVSYHDKSLQMKRIIFGNDTAHPDIASSLGNLGVTWIMLGDHRKAALYFDQALRMKQMIETESNRTSC